MKGADTMRSSRAGFVVFVWALAAPALAQDADRTAPTAKETAAIESCIGVERPTAQQRACIGRVSDPCRETQDGSTTLGMNACYSREHAIWDKLLNRVYQQAMEAFDDEGKAYLRGAQQTWLKFRSQACQWPYQVYRGGTLAGPLSGDCVMQQTALRTLDLMEILDSLSQR